MSANLSKHGPGQRPIDAVIRPFQEFAHTEASGGVLLLAFTVVALVWANSPWSHSYHELWHTTVTAGFGKYVLAKPLELWINDGLMAVFFFVVGLEIKREILTGELSSPRQAALPIAAAVGGMAVPALLYFAFNAGTPEVSGWGIPMATDIAFALGVLALVGKGVPDALKVFLTALAIVDDLGAVLVIALFYTSEISLAALGAGCGFLLLMALANVSGVRNPLVYWLLGGAVWLAFLLSGVHATIAGVLGAMTIPARSLIDEKSFVEGGRFLLSEVERTAEPGVEPLHHGTKHAAVQALERACENVETPLQRFEHRLHPWVAFCIMPTFALANAGVELGAGFVEVLRQPVALGVMIGLVAGKQVGITVFSWLAVRSGMASLPARVSWRHIYGAAVLGGIGFTMSLFIAGLAFASAEALATAKAGILVASLLAGTAGFWLLRRVGATGKA
jgi:Na+:H+ antiporter, NhaA family